MTKDKCASILENYDKIEIIVLVENTRVQQISFTDPSFYVAEGTSDTVFTTIIQGLAYKEYFDIQTKAYGQLKNAINGNLITSETLHGVQLQILDLKHRLISLLNRIMLPFGESSITVHYKVEDKIGEAIYDGSEVQLSNHFDECQKFLSTVVFEPIIEYLNITSNQARLCNNIDDFNRPLISRLNEDKSLFIRQNITESKVKQLFHLLQKEHLISPDTSEDVFLKLHTGWVSGNIIYWKGTPAQLKTLISYLSRNDKIHWHYFDLLQDAFEISSKPDYLKTKKFRNSTLKPDDALIKKLDSLFKNAS
ncbi:hypothetical protein [uncultured Mucilaginibacter sp.]|uniref:hypothetical protein n=1 Tax=uncultured Mucilaginibacter sp. TaxID=797541 RepID=UPI0025EF7783|nr:hypothetical protein [uncultured Mucilaginibacter sp.]